MAVDHQKQEFRLLLNKIKRDITANNSLVSVNNFELVEALAKLGIDSLNDLMRKLMKAKQLSRGSKDIAIQFLFFSKLAKNHRVAGDGEIIDQLIREL